MKCQRRNEPGILPALPGTYPAELAALRDSMRRRLAFITSKVEDIRARIEGKKRDPRADGNGDSER